MNAKQGKSECVRENHRGKERRAKMQLNLNPVNDKLQEKVLVRLAELFQDSFDLEIIQAVAQTCNWDFGKSTEALIVLGGSAHPPSRRNRRINSLVESSTRHKTKSLPSTLKGRKCESGALSDTSTSSMPNGLRPHPAYFSNDSLSAGQVWQRHYKSKPQSPGLLTMIPPAGKDSSVSSKAGSSRSSSRASMIKETPEVKQTGAVILRIQKLIQSNVKVMVLMRGVPGAGKTYLAQVLVGMVTSNAQVQHIFSADDYFIMLGRGVYSYDPNQVSQAHNWNQKRVSEALRRATNPVIVDNTHTQAWEMRPYVTMGVQHGYMIEVVEPVTPWKMKEAELAKRNVHNVPREKIRQMLDRYEPGWTGDKLLNLFQLKYQHCGAAHVSPEITNISNSPLTQHRHQGVMEKPEKPKRKKIVMGKKDRKKIPGLEINNQQEKQLEELNKLFAEYGTSIDPESKQKVLQAGVPITEVVSRMRKLQGTVLPMPVIPPAIIEESPQTIPEVPEHTNQVQNHVNPTSSANPPKSFNYFGLERHSPTDSVEPDTMSSSNVSETSECESDDSDPEPLKRYWADIGGHFVDGEDNWDDDEEEVKSDGAVNSRPIKEKSTGLVTSSQEELSIIDYQLSTPAGSSQDELSLLEFERGSTPPNRSSSSSDDPKTELSTLQDSLRDVLLRSAAAQGSDTSEGHLLHDIALQTKSSWNSEKIESVESDKGSGVDKSEEIEKQTVEVDLNDSLLELMRRRHDEKVAQETAPTISADVFAKNAKSPDLEEIPLPCLPKPEEPPERKTRLEGPKLETIIETLQSPPDTDYVEASKPTKKPKILTNIDPNWGNIPMPKPVLPPKPELPRKLEPLPESVSKETLTESGDFNLWRSNGSYTIILTSPRVITDENTPVPLRSKSQIAMFDKSTETADDLKESSAGLQDLFTMFPHVPEHDLADLFEKCSHDVQWVAELITDSSFENVEGKSLSPKPFEKPLEPRLDTVITDGKKTIKRKKDKKNLNSNSELSKELKKEIESSFQIGTEHYSDHVLLIKKLREGEFTMDSVEGDEEEDENIIESTVLNKEEATGSVTDAETESTFKMPLDPGFFQQLLSKFAGSSNGFGDLLTGYKPVINVPEALARQLYWLWVETLNDEVAYAEDDIVDSVDADAMLAAALQQMELQDREPTMQELADLKMAEELVEREKTILESGRRSETVAAVVSKNLLFEKYPKIGKSALLRVFESEGCSLKRTCDTLHALYGPAEATHSNFPNLPSTSSSSIHHKEPQKPLIIVKETSPKLNASSIKYDSDMLVVDPSAVRWQVQLLQKKRSEYLKLGQAEMGKKNYPTASYYFQEASRLKDSIEETQASTISQFPFPSEGSALPTTLDLHYLFTAEAVHFVDVFLDLHITRLSSGKQELHLITGRGQRSPSGRSRIKPIVQKRLAQRNLTYTEDNPGMLRVTVHPNDLLSTAL